MGGKKKKWVVVFFLFFFLCVGGFVLISLLSLSLSQKSLLSPPPPSTLPPPPSHVLVDQLLQLVRLRPGHRRHLDPSLVKLEGGDRPHLELLAQVLVRGVALELGSDHLAAARLGELDELGHHQLAGAAPGGVEVDDDERGPGVLLDKLPEVGRVELGEARGLRGRRGGVGGGGGRGGPDRVLELLLVLGEGGGGAGLELAEGLEGGLLVGRLFDFFFFFF